MSIGAIAIDGVPLDLDRVRANVSARHGRDTINDGPTAATGNVELLNLTRDEILAIDVGQELRIELDNGATIFAGVITDCALTRPDPDNAATLRLMATSILSTLGSRRVGAVDWPAEEWSNRAIRILREAGFVEGGGGGGEVTLPPLLDDFEALGGSVPVSAPWALAPWASALPGGLGNGTLGNYTGAPQVHAAVYGAPIAPDPAVAVAGTFYGLDPAQLRQTDTCVGLATPGSGGWVERWALYAIFGNYWRLDYFYPNGIDRTPLGMGAAGVEGDRMGLMLVREGDRLLVCSFAVDAPDVVTVLASKIDTHSRGVPLIPYAEPYFDPVNVAHAPIGDFWGGAIDVGAARSRSAAGPRAIVSDAWVIQPPAHDPLVVARTLDDTAPSSEQMTTALDALSALLLSTGGALVDLPDGRVLVQAIGARKELASLAVDPLDVLYSPEWQKVLDVVNKVTATFGDDDAGSVTGVAAGDSVDRYGDRVLEPFSTGLAIQSDAQARVDAIARAWGYSRWSMPACDLVDRYLLEVGQRLQLEPLPDDAPVEQWAPVVEGWLEVFDGERWSMTVSLSDPDLSGFYVEEPPPVDELVDVVLSWRDDWVSYADGTELLSIGYLRAWPDSSWYSPVTVVAGTNWADAPARISGSGWEDPGSRWLVDVAARPEAYDGDMGASLQVLTWNHNEGPSPSALRLYVNLADSAGYAVELDFDGVRGSWVLLRYDNGNARAELARGVGVADLDTVWLLRYASGLIELRRNAPGAPQELLASYQDVAAWLGPLIPAIGVGANHVSGYAGPFALGTFTAAP